jgi:hypothetical protein
MTKQDKGVVKRFIVTPDKHFPLHDKGAIGCLVKAIEIVKPDGYIDLGDVGEWHGCSHWQWKKKKRPPLEYQMPSIWEDVSSVNEGMDIIDEALDKVGCIEKYMCEGNHDDWMNKFVDEHPYLQHLRFAEAIKLKEREYEYYPNGKLLKIGKLNFYHGDHFASIHHTRNHLLRMGANIMYGHHHDIQQTSVTHVDGPKSAWSIGCMKDMRGEKNTWLGNRMHNWAHGFAIVDFYHGGLFNVHVVHILNGRTCIYGEEICA